MAFDGVPGNAVEKRRFVGVSIFEAFVMGNSSDLIG